MPGVTVLVDDVRSFSDRRACCTARSSDAGVALLRALRGVRIEHLWLDHDLVRDDTVWPVVHLLDDAALAGEPFEVGTVHVHAARSGPAHEVVVSLRRAGYNVERSTDLRLWRRTARMSTGEDPVGEWTTERAVQLATHYHEGQRDRGDPSIPYVTHPLRVMAAVRAAGYDERYQRVAVLHDGLEDTRLEATDLRAGGASEEINYAQAGGRRAPREPHVSCGRPCCGAGQRMCARKAIRCSVIQLRNWESRFKPSPKRLTRAEPSTPRPSSSRRTTRS